MIVRRRFGETLCIFTVKKGMHAGVEIAARLGIQSGILSHRGFTSSVGCLPLEPYKRLEQPAAGMMAPRDFAGMRAASVSEFAASFAFSCGNSDEMKAKAQKVADLLKDGLPGVSPNVADLGGLFRLHRRVFVDILEAAGADPAWVETWEDILDFKFAVPQDWENEYQGALKRKGGVQLARFKRTKAQRTGASMSADGTLKNFVLSRDDFPGVECKDPLNQTISTEDLEYVMDQAKIKYQHVTNGNPSIDKTMRKHMGKQLRDLFPKLPDRGIYIKGEDRDFTRMLIWRFSNPRKLRAMETVRSHPAPLCLPHSLPRSSPSRP